MATVTTSFASTTSLESGFTAIDGGISLDSALELSQAAYDYANYYAVSSYSSAPSSTYVAGTFTNGDTFASYGTNLLGYPYTINRLDYRFVADGINVSEYGAVSQASEYSDQTGYLNKIEVSAATYGKITILGYDNVALYGDGTISSVTWERDGATLTMTGALSAYVFVGGDGYYHASISGTYTAATFSYASQSIQFSGISVDANAKFAAAGDFAALALAGNDQINGTSGSELLNGYAGDDILNGGLGTDTINGGDGNDRIIAGLSDGNDQITGGAGHDILDFSAVGGVVQVNLFAGTTTGSAGSDTLSGIEEIIGSNFNDLLIGGDGNDTLNGGGGKDKFYGNKGSDILRGDAGDDTFYFSDSDGDDQLMGGDGFDALDFTTLSGVVQINQFAHTTTGTAGNDTLLDVFEMIIGSSFGDVLAGGNGGDGLKGGAGNDQMWGNAGDDWMSGGDGNDRIKLGQGNDTYDFRNGDDVDTILDFYAGAGLTDRLQFKNYTGLGTNTLAGMQAQGRIAQVGANTQITLNGGDMVILQNILATNLHADDFIFA